MRSYLKALIFDLDGTLADTIPAIAEAVNMTLVSLGYPKRSEEEIRSFIGKGPRHLIYESMPKDERVFSEKVDKALSLYDVNYAKTYIHTDHTYDGIEDAILHLSKYYKLAVLSNKQDQYVKALIDQLFPQGIFSVVRGTVNGIPAKPEPDVALEVVKELGAEPHECILIGDSEIDIITAENAGIDILSVSWGYVSKTKLILKGAQDIIGSPSELIEYFD